jgi:hypothetical protein
MKDDICKNCLWFTPNPSNNGYDICDSPEECFHGDEFVLSSVVKRMHEEVNNRIK